MDGESDLVLNMREQDFKGSQAGTSCCAVQRSRLTNPKIGGENLCFIAFFVITLVTP